MKRDGAHAILAGVNFHPGRGTGDKNFWVELVTALASRVKRISILSLRRHECAEETSTVDGCEIRVVYLAPYFLETPNVEDGRKRMFGRGGVFPARLGVLEKAFNAVRLSRIMRAIHDSSSECLHAHLMDNFGFANRIIARAAQQVNMGFSVSAMSYQARNPAVYHRYLRASYRIKHGWVVPYSLALKNKLVEIGIPGEKLVHIPWGVDPDRWSRRRTDGRVRVRLGIPSGKAVVLWSGYIQQIGPSDFRLALRVAKSALQKGVDAAFVFAFKPESYDPAAGALTDRAAGIFILKTDAKDFRDLLEAADVMLSPVANRNCILAPPLTWIEAMALGVPIITTGAGGAEELIEDGETGRIAETDEALVRAIAFVVKTGGMMSQRCMAKVRRAYNVETIAQRYVSLFSGERVQ